MKKIKNLLTVLGLFTCLPLCTWANGYREKNQDINKDSQEVDKQPEQPEKRVPLEALPNEMLEAIVKHLKTEPLIELIRVNKRFGSIIQAPSMLGPLQNLPIVPDHILKATIDERLHWAAGHGHLPFLHLLLERGADINAVDREGRTPLHYAARTGCTETVIALLERGANINAVDHNGLTPLHHAAFWGYQETVIALLERGANINAVNPSGDTPLYQATRYGDTETVIALIDRGANINAVNREGYTPLHEAAQNGHTETVIALIDGGADINTRTNNGETPLDLVIKTHRDKIITILRARGALTGAELDEAAATIIPPANHNDIGLINLDRLNIDLNDEQTRAQAYYARMLLALAGVAIGAYYGGCNIL